MTNTDDTKQAAAHTPEPWKVVGKQYDDVRIETEHPMPPQDHLYGDQTIVSSSEWTFLRDNDARRIVAAVNACKDISTEALERGIVAELLANLETLLEQIDEDVPTDITTRHFTDAYDEACATLAKATGRAS